MRKNWRMQERLDLDKPLVPLEASRAQDTLEDYPWPNHSKRFEIHSLARLGASALFPMSFYGDR